MRVKKTAFMILGLLVLVTILVLGCGSGTPSPTGATTPAVTTGSTAGGATTTAAGGAGTTAAGATTTASSATGSTSSGGAAAQGQTIFADYCSSCHGQNAEGGAGPNLHHETDPAKVQNQVRNGGQRMPPFGTQLSDAQISSVVQYVLSLNGK
jgi:mono/diheme cytochrome c family protein